MAAHIAGVGRRAYVLGMSGKITPDASPALAGSMSLARAEMLYPRPELAGLIPFVFVRDTRGAQLSFSQRFNYFAASPLCALSFSLTGVGHVLTAKEDFLEPRNGWVPPALCFVGPHPEPMASWNPGDVHGMIVCFYPDAFRMLTGTNPSDYKQSYLPMEDIVGGALLEAAQRVLEPGSVAERFDRFQDVLMYQWKEKRPQASGIANRVADWARLTTMRAAMSPTGKSLRQFERRLKGLAGMSKRELEAHAKAEETFALALKAQREEGFDLADIAATAGFADQSHMGRLTMRITGHSPQNLMHAIKSEEAYWSYRLVGGHILDR